MSSQLRMDEMRMKLSAKIVETVKGSRVKTKDNSVCSIMVYAESDMVIVYVTANAMDRNVQVVQRETL